MLNFILDELFKIHKCKPSLKWKQSFEDYLRKLPSYYIGVMFFFLNFNPLIANPTKWSNTQRIRR